MNDGNSRAADIAKRYDAARERFERSIALPAPGPRLIDPLLRLFGADSQSYAKRERALAVDRLAFDAIAAELTAQGLTAAEAARTLDEALTPSAARSGRRG